MADIKARHQRAGHLYKLPMSKAEGDKWQRRFFVAKDGFLIYYANGSPDMKHFDTKPKGMIPLGNCKVETVSRGPKGAQFGLRITHPDFLPGRALVLAADNATEQTGWAEALRRCSTVTMENALVGERLIEQMRATGTAMEKEKDELLRKATDAAMRLREETEAKLKLLAVQDEVLAKAKEGEERVARKEAEMAAALAAAMAEMEQRRTELDRQAEEMQAAISERSSALTDATAEYEKVQAALSAAREGLAAQEAAAASGVSPPAGSADGTVDAAGVAAIEARARALEEEKLRLEREKVALERSVQDMTAATERLQTTLDSSEAARKRMEQQLKDLSREEGDLAKERQLRRRLERKLQIAEESLKRLDGALRGQGVKLDVDVFADVKTLLSFFEERAEESRRDAQRIEIIKKALQAKRNYLMAASKAEEAEGGRGGGAAAAAAAFEDSDEEDGGSRFTGAAAGGGSRSRAASSVPAASPAPSGFGSAAAAAAPAASEADLGAPAAAAAGGGELAAAEAGVKAAAPSADAAASSGAGGGGGNWSYEDDKGVALPEGWIRQWDESGDVWYCSTATGETSWLRPNPDGSVPSS